MSGVPESEGGVGTVNKTNVYVDRVFGRGIMPLRICLTPEDGHFIGTPLAARRLAELLNVAANLVEIKRAKKRAK